MLSYIPTAGSPPKMPKADPWSDRASALVGLAVKRSRRGDLRVIVFAASPKEPKRD